MPLFWSSIAMLAGVLASQTLSLAPAWWLGAAGLAAFAALLLRRLTRLPAWLPAGRPPFLILLAAACLGGARFSVTRLPPAESDLARYNERTQEVVLVGMLVEPPSVRDRRTFLKVSAISLRDAHDPGAPEMPVKGMLRAGLDFSPQLNYGDMVSLRGRLRAPPRFADFDYPAYLAAQDIHTVVHDPQIQILERGAGSPFWRLLYAAKERFLGVIYAVLPDPEASLLAGILLGRDENLPPALVRAFQDTGTSHVIAISGFNIGIVAGLFSNVFGRLLGRRRGFWASVGGITLYTLLVGAGAPVVRAAIMGGSALFARQIGRRQDGLNALAICAALMCLWNPYLLQDVSFQLSFAATLGLVLYAAPLAELFEKAALRFLPAPYVRRISGPIAEYVLFTLAAQLTTLPIILYHFQRLSLSSLLVNPLILPAQPPVMILGGVTVLCGALVPFLGKACAVLVYPFLLYTIRLVEGFSSLSGGVVVLDHFPFSSVVVSYVLLFGFTMLLRLCVPLRRWVRPVFAGAGLILLTVAVWHTALRAPDGRLTLTVLPGDDHAAILLRSPAGRTLLIGGGDRPSVLSAALGRRLPFFSRRMDAWLVFASQMEQMRALEPLFERYPSDSVYWLDEGGAAPPNRLAEAVNDKKISQHSVHPGQAIDLGDGTRLLWLDAGRGRNVHALLITYGNFRTALVSGAATGSLRIPGTAPLAALVSMQTSSGGRSGEWAASGQAHVVVLPEGPSMGTLQDTRDAPERLNSNGHTWISLVSDGERLWIYRGNE